MVKIAKSEKDAARDLTLSSCVGISAFGCPHPRTERPGRSRSR